MNSEELDLGCVFELLGDVVSYEKDNFTQTNLQKRIAVENLFLMGFAETEYDDDTDFLLASGEKFDLVGVSDEYDMYMISFGGQLFCCDRSEVDLSSNVG